MFLTNSSGPCFYGVCRDVVYAVGKGDAVKGFVPQEQEGEKCAGKDCVEEPPGALINVAYREQCYGKKQRGACAKAQFLSP